ncbi:hypothetical protein IGK74_002433 [Enterococcus sp. AZ150]|uniref:hypothetical protein n=1 Tax=Enterococcus sp. AZ150 TaxID=2774866 RepID=UPI003F231F9C
MIIENTAVDEKGIIEKTITTELLENGNIRIIAKEHPVNENENFISMEFTKNGFNALLGSMLAISKMEEQS